MPRTEPFQAHTDRYEEWFETFAAAYESEIDALRSLRSESDRSLEIGVGSGRFAGPLDIEYGLDPAPAMLENAIERDIEVVQGVAETLPFGDDTFDLALIVTAICFVDDVEQTIQEAARVLEPGGTVQLGYIDRDSRVGQHYQAITDENPFYRDATFLGTEEVIDVLETVGFEEPAIRQTIFQMPDEMTDPDESREGYGDGSFVALAAEWPGM